MVILKTYLQFFFNFLENKNLKDLIEHVKNENFRLNNQITTNTLEKQDFIQQLKKSDENQENLKIKILQYEQKEIYYLQKDENLKKITTEFFQKENEKILIINQKDTKIDNLLKQISNLEDIIKDKDIQILTRTNDFNNILSVKCDLETQVVNLHNNLGKEKETVKDLNLQFQKLNSENNLKTQLNENQINNLNNIINQLNNEIKLTKENLFLINNQAENKFSELTNQKEILKNQIDIINNQNLTLQNTLNIKQGEIDDYVLYCNNLQKTINKLNHDLSVCSEIINDRDLEINKIYQYKDKYDKYIYIEKNLDIFNVINSSDANLLKDELKKIYSINKDNKNQIENLISINEKLRKESQEYNLLKEKSMKLEEELNSCKINNMNLKIYITDLEKNKEDLSNEISVLKELKKRLSTQNKNLVFESKMMKTNYNILSANTKNKEEYERFLYNNIEDLEGKNTELHSENIRIKLNLENYTKNQQNFSKEIHERECIIAELKEYIEQLEESIQNISSKINTISYYRECGIGIGIPPFNFKSSKNMKFSENEELKKLDSQMKENKILIEDLKSKNNLLEKINFENCNEKNNKSQEILNLKELKLRLENELGKYKNEINILNYKISNLENQVLIKENYIISANNEKQEIKNSLENLRIQKDSIFDEISKNSKQAITKLNENKQIFIDQIEKLMQENLSLKYNFDNLYNNLQSLISSNNEIKSSNKNLSENINLNSDLSIFENISSLNNLYSLLTDKEKENLILNNNFDKSEINTISKKLEILRKLLIIADKNVNNLQDSKIKIENLNSLISNLEYKNKIYENRIFYLENLMKESLYNNIHKLLEEKVNSNAVDMDIDLPNNQTSKKSNKVQEYNINSNNIKPIFNKPQMKILNSSIISTNSNKNKIESENINKINNEIENNNLNINENNYSINKSLNFDDLQQTPSKIEKKLLNSATSDFYNLNLNEKLLKNYLFKENSTFLTNYFDILRQNDNYRIVNLELNSRIVEIKKLNEEIIENKFNNKSQFSDTSKFFFNKYNELLLEKTKLESIINNDKTEIANLHNNIVELNKEISNNKIEKKDLEKLYFDLEKNFNEEIHKNIKVQENLYKKIDESNLIVQNFSKEKSNFTNVFNKIKTDKLNLENIIKNNLSEITSLKENIINKDNYVNNLKLEIENLNKKLNDQNLIKQDLENKIKLAGEAKNNIWVRKLCTILQKSKIMIQTFIQLKTSLEEKIKTYENSLLGGINSINVKQGEFFNSNNIFTNALNEINSKMAKYDLEIKNYKRKEETFDKKINSLTNEINLLQEKEKSLVNDLKNFKGIYDGNVIGRDPEKEKEGANLNIKNYFSKMIKYLNTAKNIINFKDGMIKKMESDVQILTNKLNEGKIFF